MREPQPVELVRSDSGGWSPRVKAIRTAGGDVTRAGVEGVLVTSGQWPPGGASTLRSYPVALGGVYGLLAGGGAGAHAVYVLTVGGVAVVRRRPPHFAQGLATTTAVAGVGERARPAGNSRSDGRDHRPERVPFESRTGGKRSLRSSSGGLGANQWGDRSHSGAFEGGFQRGDGHLGYGHRWVFFLVAF